MDIRICSVGGCICKFILVVIMAIALPEKYCSGACLAPQLNTLNTNYSISWAPPGDGINDTNVLYTVKYKKIMRKAPWNEVANCVNITRLFCSLWNKFTMNDLKKEHKVKVTATLSSTGEEIDYCTQRISFSKADIGAPAELKVINRTSSKIKILLVTPLTPYTYNGQQLRWTDLSASELNMLSYVVKFNYTVKANGERIERREKLYEKDGETFLTLKNLTPNTNYVVLVQNSYHEHYSHDVTAIQIKTLNRAPKPPSKPSILSIQVDCERPKMRDVQINWQPPPKEDDWDIDLTHFEVHYTSDFTQLQANSLIIPILDKSNQTTDVYSAVIPDLSRWWHYTLWITAHNSGGYSFSDYTFIPVSTIDTTKSAPMELVAKSSSVNDVLISWKPPVQALHDNDNAACVKAYLVQIHLLSTNGDIVDVKNITIENGTSYNTNSIKHGKYDIKVTSDIHAGLHKSKLGGTATVQFEIIAAPKPPSKPILSIQVDCERPDMRDIKINWQPPPKEEWEVDLTHFKVHYTSDFTQPISIIIPTLDIDNQTTDVYSALIPNLSRWWKYTFWITAHNSGGDSTSNYTFVPASTIDTTKSAPVELAAESTSVNDVLISWKPPVQALHNNDDAACVKAYHFQLLLLSTNGDNLEVENIKIENETSYIASSMKRGKYDIKVTSDIHVGLNKSKLGGTARMQFNLIADRLPSWIIPSAVVISLITIVAIVVTLIHRNCYYRLVNDNTLKDNKILEKALSIKPSLPFRHQNSEIIDEVSRYFPMETEETTELQEPLTPSSDSTYFSSDSTQQQTPPTSPRFPSSVDIEEMDDFDPLKTPDTTGTESERSFHHLYNNVNRPKKVSKGLILKHVDETPLETGNTSLAPTPLSEISEDALWEDSNVREDISPYSNMSDVMKKGSFGDNTTHTLNENEMIFLSEQESPDILDINEKICKNVQHPAEETGSSNACRDLNMKKAQEKTKYCLNNNTMVIPTPYQSGDQVGSSDADIEVNTLDFSCDFEVGATPDISKPAEAIADNSNDAYTTIDKLGLPGSNDGLEKPITCPDDRLYVQHAPKYLENTRIILSDKDEYHKTNREGQSITTIDYCPHDHFQFPSLSPQTSSKESVEFESNAEGNSDNSSPEPNCFACLPGLDIRAKGKIAPNNIGYTKLADLELLVPSIKI